MLLLIHHALHKLSSNANFCQQPSPLDVTAITTITTTASSLSPSSLSLILIHDIIYCTESESISLYLIKCRSLASLSLNRRQRRNLRKGRWRRQHETNKNFVLLVDVKIISSFLLLYSSFYCKIKINIFYSLLKLCTCFLNTITRKTHSLTHTYTHTHIYYSPLSRSHNIFLCTNCPLTPFRK